MNIAIFPLPICILPQGYTQLRVFEPRYLRMVSESMKSNKQFGIVMLNENKTLLEHGTLVEIVDFDTLENNMLAITVKGLQNFKLGDIKKDTDELTHSNVKLSPLWQPTEIKQTDEQELKLKQTLISIFEQYPQHKAIYHEHYFNDISWVCQRWLEILPLSSQQKQQCISQTTHQLTQKMLAEIIKVN
ncbi:LON peptidase substrate-binding domain-containing protein [Shewanella intestini]|uniref:Peptidase S16 n=1 Tax=Shewanella intestini TaxID=2017544 RepID=A0ABS5HZ50_9GAMM|nr:MULTISPECIES: LON peptidase substrate-binding domain-containing protein [Shewanella]MBR9727059.1 peptidase S16 [Shewanella intestini]MRG35861.1 peptidase S16 [Shewanella sp. XMDDZSB0408]